MDYFGINSADDLPKISEVLMEEFTKATSVNDIMEANAEEAAAIEAAGLEETIEAEEALSIMDDTEATITEDVVEEPIENENNTEDKQEEEA
jgi:segregation and condensation protein B